jgi:hypothetical protein
MRRATRKTRKMNRELGEGTRESEMIRGRRRAQARATMRKMVVKTMTRKMHRRLLSVGGGGRRR